MRRDGDRLCVDKMCTQQHLDGKPSGAKLPDLAECPRTRDRLCVDDLARRRRDDLCVPLT